jgi:hypothetical protein
MALDSEDSLDDAEATDSECDDNNLLPVLVVLGGNNPEEVARQTASVGFPRGLHTFKVLDHLRPVGRKGLINSKFI